MKKLVFYKNYTKSFLKAHLKKNNEPSSELYNKIGILNPSIGTSNLGDLIIYDSVYKILRELFPDDMMINFPTQIHTTFDAMSLMSEQNLMFVSGTNLLSSNLESRYQWKIHKGHKKFLKNKVVLFGCGWWQYQDEINKYSKDIYKTILNSNFIHSARDQYTVDKFKEIGINNVLNTSCPTLWEISPSKCELIPRKRGEEVVTTLTFYHKNSILDFQMLDTLSKKYKKVYLWIQGMNDVYYFNDIASKLNNVELLAPTIEAYNEILKRPNIDYIGTRLHAGVRALQNNVRTLILAVDNRAYEIGKDVNLNVIKRENVQEISYFIDNEYVTDIKLPVDNIARWKESFKLSKR